MNLSGHFLDNKLMLKGLENCESCHLRADRPAWSKQASDNAQGNKLTAALLCGTVSVPASQFQPWVSALAFLNDRLETLKKNNKPFPNPR